MTKQARIAVVGTGWWATATHLPALKANPRAEVVALCDPNPEKLAAAAAAYGIETTYGDLDQMLASEQLDGAIVATPHATHYKLARACLAAGLHVIVEKPLTIYARDARELVELAASRGRELIVGYPWHYAPHVLRAREVLRSGELGAIEFISCTFTSAIRGLLSGRDSSHGQHYAVHGPGAVYGDPALSGGGMGHLQITHSAGVMSFLSGLRPQRVLAQMRNHGLAVDMVDSISVAFEGGALGVVGGSGNGLYRKLDVQIHCEQGAVDLDLVRDTLTVRRPDDSREEFRQLSGDESYPKHAPVNNLVAIVCDGAPNASPPEPGLHTVELLDAAYRSASKDGQPVEVASLYE
jgi:predicted dehydrogenase